MNAKNKKLLAIVGVAAVLLIVIGVSVSMLGKGRSAVRDGPGRCPHGCYHGGCEPAPGGRNYDAHSGGPRCFRAGKHPRAGTG